MAKTDIFIKTYHKDFHLLEWCLRSINSFARGFNQVIIVSDIGHDVPDICCGIPIKVHYVDVGDKLGYLWQKSIKLSWYEYTDADDVLILDSDEMLTVETTPDSFKDGEKYIWHYKHWVSAVKPLSNNYISILLGRTTIYSNPLEKGFIFERKTSVLLNNFICQKFNYSSIWDVFISKELFLINEYTIYGCFLGFFGSQYNKIFITDEESIFGDTIRNIRSWSIGTLKYRTNPQFLQNDKPTYNFLVSFRRSGRHLAERLLRKYNFNFWQHWPDVPDVPDYNTLILVHEEAGDYKFLDSCNKAIVFYRKDIVKQIDSILRFDKKLNELQVRDLNGITEHQTCSSEICYDEHIPEISKLKFVYNKFVKLLVNSNNPNLLIVDYDSLVTDPHKTLFEMLQFLDTNINDLVNFERFIKDENISYKNTISSEKYNELKALLE